MRLNLDSTELFLEDYLMDLSILDSLTVTAGLEVYHQIAEKKLLLLGQAEENVAVLSFWMKGEKLDLPLKKSFAQRITFQFLDSLHQYQKVEIAGGFNGWTASRGELSFNESNRNWERTFVLNEGEESYRLHLDGVEQLDPSNPSKKENGLGGYNSVWKIGNMEETGLLSSSLSEEGLLQFESPNKEAHWLYFYHNQLIQEDFNTERSSLSIILEGNGLLHIYEGPRELVIPIKEGRAVKSSAQLDRKDRHAMILYFMMLDRFKNGDLTNDPSPLDSVLPIAQYLGGDLAGLHQVIESGYFDQLHVNTFWISPISPNPTDAWGLWDKGGVRTRFSAYHGYWPTSFAGIDSRFGTEKELSNVIRLAHAEESNVLLDYVAHHVHISHPLYKEHPDWVTQLHLPDGTLNTERWDEYRLSTWFDVFLPTLDMARPEVCEAVTDSAMYWFRSFDLDGLRHDATKHVPNEYWRMLTRKLRTQCGKSGEDGIYQIGETYGSADLIHSYLGSGLMDAQFDFNLYDAALQCFALDADSSKQAACYQNLAATLKQSLRYYGPHHLMGNISGNQDKPRFVSIADGSVKQDEDTKLAGYTRNIQHQGEHAFARLAMMHAFNYCIPGVPIVYYGDEIGLPGANDPDNRRMMRFDSLTAPEELLRNQVSELGKIRSENLALVYGSTQVISGADYLLVVREYLGEKVIAIFSKYGTKHSVALPQDLQHLNWQQLGGNYIKKGAAITLGTNGYLILKAQKP